MLGLVGQAFSPAIQRWTNANALPNPPDPLKPGSPRCKLWSGSPDASCADNGRRTRPARTVVQFDLGFGWHLGRSILSAISSARVWEPWEDQQMYVVRH